MYRTLLVPVDGAPHSEHAIPWALSLAQKDNAAIHLVRVHIPPAPILVSNELAADVALDNSIRKSETEYLTDLAESLRKTTTVAIHDALIEGAVADGIDDYARTIKADLIVMTTHGRGALARFWLGSVADRLMRHGSVPMLLVRPNEQQAADLLARPFIHRIVVPLDGSDLAEKIVEPAMELGKTAGADFSLVIVLEAVEDIEKLADMKIKQAGGWFPEATIAKAQAYLERIAHRMRGHACKVETKVIQHGRAAEKILEQSGTHGSAVIALATHGRGGIRRALLGSVADKVVRAATLPVLVFRPSEQ